MDCKLHWYLKYYNHAILFLSSNTFSILIGSFLKSGEQTFQLIILIKRWVIFVYHYT